MKGKAAIRTTMSMMTTDASLHERTFRWEDPGTASTVAP